MQRVLFHIILFVWSVMPAMNTVYGQQADIRLVDDKSGEPVPFAHVLIESLISKKTINTISSEKGEISTNIQEPSLIRVSNIGYESLTDSISPGESKTIRLTPVIFNMGEIVVTAQYTPQRVDKSIYKVKVISQKEIEQKASRNLSDLFSDALNIRINQDGSLGSSMSIRGLSGEHIKFLVDGVPVIGRMNGNIDLGQINLHNVEHIEIIEGPMSVVYGSNALGGVINIITRENKSIPFQFGAETYMETAGTYNFNLSASARKNRNAFSLSGARNFFEGTGENGADRYLTWKPKRQYMLDGYYLYDHPAFKIKYTTHVFDELLWNKGNVIKPHYAIDNYFDTRRFNNAIDFSTKIGDKRYLRVVTGYSVYKRIKSTWFKDLHSLEKNLTTNDGDQDSTGFNAFNFRGELSKSNEDDWFNYQFGIDLNTESGSGQKLSKNQQQIGDYAAFMSLRMNLYPTLTLQPGARLIYNTSYSAPLIYSLNLKWMTASHTTFRGSYSRGFRAPSLKELYLFFVDVNHNIRGNENLKAEDSHNLLLAWNYLNEHGKAQFGMGADLFYNTINNVITLARVRGDLYTYINLDNYTTQGIQVELFYHLYPRFRWNIGVIYTGRRNLIEKEDTQINDFYYSTDANTNLTYRISKIKTDVSFYYKYTGRLPQIYQSTNGTLEEGYLDHFNTLDITLSRSFIKSRLRVAVGVKNAFDVRSIQATGAAFGGVHGGSGSSLIGYGRFWFATLSYNFIKF